MRIRRLSDIGVLSLTLCAPCHAVEPQPPVEIDITYNGDHGERINLKDRVCFPVESGPANTGTVTQSERNTATFALDSLPVTAARMFISNRPELYLNPQCNGSALESVAMENCPKRNGRFQIGATIETREYFVLELIAKLDHDDDIYLSDLKFGLFNPQCDLAKDQIPFSAVWLQENRSIVFQPNSKDASVLVDGRAGHHRLDVPKLESISARVPPEEILILDAPSKKARSIAPLQIRLRVHRN